MINGDTMYDGACLSGTCLGASRHVDAAEAYQALARAKLAANAARAAAVSGNCGLAQERMTEAWGAFTTYAQISASVGQSPATAITLLKNLAKYEQATALACSAMNGSGFGFWTPHIPDGVKRGATLAAVAVGAILLTRFALCPKGR